MEILHTMRTVSGMIADVLTRQMINELVNNEDINFEDFVNKASTLVGHFPKFEEVYQMSTTPCLWSDLFSVECNMLSNRLLLDTNIEITKLMASHISKGTVDSSYLKKMDLLSRIQSLSEINMYNNSSDRGADERGSEYQYDGSKISYSNGLGNFKPRDIKLPTGFVNGTTLLRETMSKNRNSHNTKLGFSSSNVSFLNSSLNGRPESGDDKQNPEHGNRAEVAILFSIVSNLCVYNERLERTCSENRDFYTKSCKKLLYLSERELVDRPEYILRARTKVIQFLKQLSRAFDIDKCTHNLSILFFDTYLHQRSSNPSESFSPLSTGYSVGGSSTSYFKDSNDGGSKDFVGFTDNELMKIGVACYLLAGALREHWVDINKDKYLDQAIEMSCNMFTTKEIVSLQLDVLHRMPRGFSSIYTVMEYGLFFLANIKYINYDLNMSPNSVGDTRLNFYDDFLFLSSAFNFMAETGGLCWMYHCLSKWDDMYVAKNWNWFIPPSRAAAVLIFHFFSRLFDIDVQKDLIWCRRFCHRVFRMFYDSDVALWYHVFKENAMVFLMCVEKTSARMNEMSTLYAMAAEVFRTIEGFIYAEHARIILEQFPYELDKSPYRGPLGLPDEIVSIIETKISMSKSLSSSSGRAKINGLVRDRSPDPNKPPETNKSLYGLDYNTLTILFSRLIEPVKKLRLIKFGLGT